ncbi:MAG: response regulator transcription factor [Thermomicrobiales bacterium]
MLARRVLLVDDHPVFRAGLRRVLEATGRYEVVGEAGNAHQAIRIAEEMRPGLILLDVQLPGITGLRIMRILRRKQTRARIVVLSVHVDDDRIIEAVRAGAVGFLQKDIGAEGLTAALARICAGENLLRTEMMTRPDLARRLRAELRLPGDAADNEGPMPLSTRELAVLDCVAQGLSNREIADALFVSEQTVKNHMTSVLRKLNATDRVGAILHAVRQGWMEVAPPNFDPLAAGTVDGEMPRTQTVA